MLIDFVVLDVEFKRINVFSNLRLTDECSLLSSSGESEEETVVEVS